MNESIDNISLNDGKKASKTAFKVNIDDSDNDSNSRYSNLELSDTPGRLPPSKKLKSIIHSFFDDNDNDNDETIVNENNSENNKSNKTVYIDETSSSNSGSETD